ncbi:Exocyst complex component Exo70 [Sesbania bispinosa]|nr:Exocyst complex component Exo70 [Sesbania bispinosa]
MPKMGRRKRFFFKPPPPVTPTFLPPVPQIMNISDNDSLRDEKIETARYLITKWDPIPISNQPQSPFNATTTAPLFSNTRHEAKQYLDSIKSLQSSMQNLIARDSSSEELVQAHFLMQLAMKRLETEFYRILAKNKAQLDPESFSVLFSSERRSSVSDYDEESFDDEFSESVMADLKAIADCMVSAGYSKECIRIYTLVRKSIVDESLSNLGVERLSVSQVQKMEWEVLEPKIKCWLSSIKVAVGTLFHGEKTLCETVFGESKKKIAESCFVEVCREAASCLFGFPRIVAKCKKTPEKMFRTLDMYEAISHNWKRIESTFSFESTSAIKSQAIASKAKLAKAVRKMLSNFESAIQKESSKIPVPGGGVHPLTRYVMNYIALLAEYRRALAEIVADWPQNPLPESYYRNPDRVEKNPPSEIAERVAWLILMLLCKIDGKSELYKDVALSYLFLANNMQYVVVKVRKSKLRLLLGEDWLKKQESKVKDYISKYERMGWSKVLSSLPENPTAEIPAEQATAMFQSFEAAFHEACRVQYSWVVSDPKLRDEIEASIALKVVPRYLEFYNKYWVGSESEASLSPDDLADYLSDILYGLEGHSGSVSSQSPSIRFRFKRR